MSGIYLCEWCKKKREAEKKKINSIFFVCADFIHSQPKDLGRHEAWVVELREKKRNMGW